MGKLTLRIANRAAITRTFGHVPQAAEAWLRTWLSKAAAASWWSDAHVLGDYPAAICDGSGGVSFAFAARGYTLSVYIAYRSGVIDVDGVFDAAGTRI